MTTVVIKYGGHAMDKEDLRNHFAQSLVNLSKGAAGKPMRFAIVHGGGPHITGMLQRLHIESRFEQGLRVTDDATMDVVEMVLCGHVNKALVTYIQQAGGSCMGISGKDGALFSARVLRPELGRVGEITHVDTRPVTCLWEGGFTPIIAPVAMGASGESLNINADTAAGALAGGLSADYFVLVSDVPGVLNAQGVLLPSLSRTDVDALKADGTIHGGMIPKVDACLHALHAGCHKALILDGRSQASLERYLVDGAPLGTIIQR